MNLLLSVSKIPILQKRIDYSDFPFPLDVKLRPHEGQFDKFVCIANPQSGQTRFVCKCVTIRDTRIIPKSSRIRNATSHGPICIFTLKFRYVVYPKLSLKRF